MSEEEKRQRMMAKMMRGMTSGMNGPQQEFSEAPGQQDPEEFANVSFDTKVNNTASVKKKRWWE